MKIKVCGMRDTDNIRAVSALDINMMGFNFIPHSPRYVEMISSMSGIIPDYSEERLAKGMQKQELQSVANRIERVGVFADDMPQTIVTRVYNYCLDYVQLNGNESRVMIENLLRTLKPDIQPNIKIFKTLSISSQQDLEQCKEFKGVVDLFLFVPSVDEEECQGKKPDWSVLKKYEGYTPFLLG
ncbi:MAG: phosphoribosylanthranilate isomerase, partial [Hoylesella buccalis]